LALATHFQQGTVVSSSKAAFATTGLCPTVDCQAVASLDLTWCPSLQSYVVVSCTQVLASTHLGASQEFDFDKAFKMVLKEMMSGLAVSFRLAVSFPSK
jgi:hypothetical protein